MASDYPGYVKQDFDQGELSFLFRSYNPLENRHCKYFKQNEVKEEVLKSPRLRTLISDLALEQGIEEKEIEKVVSELLDEIGHKMTIVAVKTIALLIRGPLRRIVRGSYIQKKGLEELRAAVTQWPVVLLPSHRSYLDFIMVSYFMLEFNIQLPAIAAGQDFMNMQFVSGLLRRSGAFFLRRTFGSDRLYKLVFTLYTQVLLCTRDHPVEFFVEGTRSRTSKSLHPKLGLLSMIVEPYLNGLLPDILLFPISISYERTLEEDLFARELLGIPKPKESTSGLLKARSLLTASDYGSIFINFSTPISLHDMCQKWGISRVPHGLFPRDVFVFTKKERDMMTKLGYFVLEKIISKMRVFPSTILATIMLQHQEGINKDELMRQAVWLKEETEIRGAQVDWREDALQDSLKLLSTCVETTPSGIVQIRMENHSLPGSSSVLMEEAMSLVLSPSDKQKVMEDGFVCLKLARYRNQLLHWFTPEAIFLLCIHSTSELTTAEMKRRFTVLCTALSREFVLPQIPVDELFVNTVQVLIDRGLILTSENGETLSITPHERQENAVTFMAHLVQPFVAGVWVMCQYLLSLHGGVQTLKSTFKGAQLLAAKFIHLGILNTYEPLSLDMLKNAVASLNVAGLILQPELELEGRDRLVKVAHQEELWKLTQEIGIVLFSDETGLSNVSLATSQIHAKI